MLDPVTLDQLRMLVAIADTGSFTAAAKRLQRAQSAVSHAISALEAQLDLSLFDRSERKPRLTPAGHAVLSDARLAIARMDQLKRRAREIAGGLETELRVAVTVLAPQQVVVAALDGFRVEFPSVAVELFVEEIGGSTLLVHEGVCQLGVSGSPSLRMTPDGQLTTLPIGSTDIIAVARPDHPLVLLNRALTQEDLNEHRQLVPTSRARAEYPNALSREIWRVSDLHARRAMILRGIGWGTVPAHMVVEDLAAGRLVELTLASRAPELMRADLFAIHRTDVSLGPAGRWLIAQLGHALATGEPSAPRTTAG